MGIGKTALLDAAARMAGDLLVLRGRGGEVEREVGFGLVRGCRAAAPVGSARRPRALALGRRELCGRRARRRARGQRRLAAVAYGLFWLLAAIAGERPVVLIADDLHDCDPHRAAGSATWPDGSMGLPVALLGATHPLERDELPAIDDVRVIRPEPLHATAMRDLIASAGGVVPDPAFVEACRAATGGNPLLLHDLIEALQEQGLAPGAASASSIEHSPASGRAARCCGA